ncbi:MAG: hypothetical protein ACWA41_04065 [Putridiphycobacter sp.]
MKEEKDILKTSIIEGFKNETPSIDFTQKVMEKVEASLNEKPIIQPLISKKTWLIILSSVSVILTLSFFIDTIQTLDFDHQILKPFENINWSSYKMTFQLFIGIMVVISTLFISDLFYRKWKHLS